MPLAPAGSKPLPALKFEPLKLTINSTTIVSAGMVIFQRSEENAQRLR